MRPCVRRFAEAIDKIMPVWDHQSRSENDLLNLLDEHVCLLDAAEDAEHQAALVRVARDCMFLWDNKELGRYGQKESSSADSQAVES